jgi:hypothetical protein
MSSRAAFAKLTGALALLTIMPAGGSQALVADAFLPTPDVNSYIIMPIHCDSAGDIFLQPPLSKINSEGRRTAVFDLAAARSDGLANLVFKAFAVDPGGSLYQLARMEDQRVAIVKFDSDGHYTGSTILDQKFEPQQLGVFTGDVFLVSGTTLIKGGAKPEFAPYAAMFDRSGRLIKTVDTAEPASALASEQGGSPAKQNGAANLSGLPELGIVESHGGHVYFLRQGRAPTVLAVSAVGIVDHKLTLSSPYQDANVSGFRVGTGQLLIEYARPNALPNGNTAYYLMLYDAQTGEKISEYSRDDSVSGVLGCTDWKGNFTFLSTDNDGKPVLVKASRR